MTIKIRTVLFTLTLCIIAAILILQAKAKSAPAQPTDWQNIALPTLSGEMETLGAREGTKLIVNFWATWCSPCLKEIPEFVALQNELANTGIQFIGIAIDEKQAVAHFIQRLKINYPILIAEDNGSRLTELMGNKLGYLPYTVIVDERQQIVYQHEGLFDREAVLSALKQSL